MTARPELASFQIAGTDGSRSRDLSILIPTKLIPYPDYGKTYTTISVENDLGEVPEVRAARQDGLAELDICCYHLYIHY